MDYIAVRTVTLSAGLQAHETGKWLPVRGLSHLREALPENESEREMNGGIVLLALSVAFLVGFGCYAITHRERPVHPLRKRGRTLKRSSVEDARASQ
jgi:hypothetical protein